MEFTQKDEKSADEYRKRFVRLTVAQDNEVEDRIDEIREEVSRLVKNNSGNEIRDEGKISSGLAAILATFASLYLSTLVKFNTETANVVGEQQKEIIFSKYKSDGIRGEVSRDVGNLTELIRKTFPYRSFPTDGITVGDRIKSLEGGSLKTARDILSVGIKEGKSAKQIAEDLDNYLKPKDSKTWVGPFDWYRDRFGYKINKVPKDRPAGSLYFNSLRISRTEINYTYRQSTVLVHRNKKWVNGYIWNLSPSHPAHDICDDWAANSPYKDEKEILALGHPFCMCFITVDLVDESDL